MNTLRMPRKVFDEMRAHGEQTYPDECCGALLCRPTAEGWQLVKAVRAANARTDAAHHRYEIAPAELVRMEREARDQRLEIGGFYHSHPDHPAQWSATDLGEAHWLGCAYVITEVARGRAAATNAFLLAGNIEEDKRFEPLAIRVEDEDGVE